MSVKRYTPNYKLSADETEDGDFVHYSDYEKLVKALRFILREASYDYKGVAEAALLSAGEEL